MRYLLDENLHESAARALDVLNGPGEQNDRFEHILDHHAPGAQDPVIPPLCRDIGIDTLMTANVKDFGARLYYYQALLANDIHVVVVRPGRVKRFGPAQQVAIVATHYGRMAALMEPAETPTLLKMTPTSCDPRSLEELVDEIEGRAKKLP